MSEQLKSKTNEGTANEGIGLSRLRTTEVGLLRVRQTVEAFQDNSVRIKAKFGVLSWD